MSSRAHRSPSAPAYFAPTATLARPVAPVPDRFQRLPKAMQLAITTLLEPLSFEWHRKTGLVLQFHMDFLSPHETSGRGKRNKPENVWLSIINGETENYGPTELSVDDFMYWRQGLSKIPNSPAKPIAFGAMDDGEQDISVFSLCDGPVYTLRGFAGETMVWAVGWYIGDTPDRRNIAAKNQLSYPRCCADRHPAAHGSRTSSPTPSPLPAHNRASTLLALFHTLHRRLLRARPTLKLCIHWVPAHVGIAGNEAVDARAKEVQGASSVIASRIIPFESALPTRQQH
ncbi:hypothetical protein B0H11DRAFT_2255240 [Mycena galericulata]|nr:hypothetical protein B0H11DRAFT_2255240 [Mycena galericulata]